MKAAKRFNSITGLLLLVYGFVQLYITLGTMRLAESPIGQMIVSEPFEVYVNKMVEDPFSNEFAPVMSLGILMFFAGFFALVLFVLGIFALIYNIKTIGKGRVIGIVASSLCIGGFLVGWITGLNIVYIFANAILFFISYYYYDKQIIV